MKSNSKRGSLQPLRLGALSTGNTIIGFVVLLAFAVGMTRLRADTFVIPQGLENVEGRGDIRYPFNTQTEFSRLQFLLDDSLFSGPAPGFRITGIAFRASGDRPGATFDVTFGGVEIRMSTTSRSPESMSETFSANIGLDETVVFPRVPVRWSTTVVPGQVNPWSLSFALTTPYDYFPSKGNLLMDITVFQGANTYHLDSERLLDSQHGVMFTAVEDPRGVFAAGSGIVTRFDFEAIPEPSAGLLLALGFSALLITRSMKRR